MNISINEVGLNIAANVKYIKDHLHDLSDADMLQRLEAIENIGNILATATEDGKPC